ncbi:hypothetical protein HanPI659440_Chr03g0138591 [Helianthus annuus]|nr:hypothetical protein HanPI659440_Chr03g0138591 [Helianthus annuus]
MFPSRPAKDEQIRWSQCRSSFHGICKEIHRGLLLGRNPRSPQYVPQNIPHPVVPIFETRELLTMNSMLPVFIHAGFTANWADFVF